MIGIIKDCGKTFVATPMDIKQFGVIWKTILGNIVIVERVQVIKMDL